MKKIFTLFMAFGIALCAMANSTISVAEKSDLFKTTTPKMEKQFTPVEQKAKAVRLDKQEARQAKAAAVQPVAKQAIPANAVRKAPAKVAAEATDTVEFVAAKWKYQYYSDSGDWWMAVIDPTGTYRLDFDYIVPEENFAGTYTTEDLDLGYSYLTISDEEGYVQYVDYVEATLTVTASAEGKFLTANVLCDNGTRFLVTAAELPLPEAKDTVELAYTNATLVDGTASSSTFQFWGDENGVYTSFLMYSNQVEGKYTKDNMYVDYANFILFVDGTDSTFVEFLALDLVITKEDRTYYADAYALGVDTVMYHITMSYTKPAPTETIDIVATNMTVDEFEFFGMVFCTVSASNDEYTVTLDMANGLPMGELTSADFNVAWSSVYRIADATEIVFDEIVSATVSEVEGKPAIKAQVVGVDNILYNLDLSYVVPEATDTVHVVFDELAEAQYYAEYGDYYIVNQNESYIVTLDIFADKDNFVGEYATEDFDFYYTQLGVINGDTTVVTIADAKAVVTPVEEGIVLIEAELTGMNAVLYKVSTKVDISNKGLQYDATEGFLMDEYTTEDLYTINDQSAAGYIMLDVESADGNDLMGLVFWVDGADEKTIIPTGTYQINGTTESGTVLASTGMGSTGLTYSLYATLDEEGYIVEPCWFMVGGEVVVSEKDGILSIYVDAVNSNDLPIFITCEYDLSTKQGLQYDMTEGSLDVTYNDNDIVEINTEYLAEGVIYLDVVAADGSNTISVAFFVEETDPVITIPEGTYLINDTQDYGTVMSSPGVQGGYIYPSFYCNMNAEGGLITPCYFMVSGEVVVENVNDHLKVTINALNSYDVPATIVYEAVETGVENINVNVEGVQKQIVDGQLYIIREGKAFNVMGAQVK
ncbi:MAG: hypothetical protein J6S09_08185 [Paludibacteraceae bacterium]|nr:hypothetical protein [Paludibacteraceae bacterium]